MAASSAGCFGPEGVDPAEPIGKSRVIFAELLMLVEDAVKELVRRRDRGRAGT